MGYITNKYSNNIEVRNLLGSYHKFYKKEEENPVDVKVYMSIVFGFIKFIMSKVLDGCDVDLGPGDSLGTIGVRGRKVEPLIDENGEIRGVAPSWAKTKQLWDSNPEAKAKKTLVYCFNEHSNGIKYRFFWYKEDARLHNKIFYSLAVSRDNKRDLMRAIKAGKEYVVIPKQERREFRIRNKDIRDGTETSVTS